MTRKRFLLFVASLASWAGVPDPIPLRRRKRRRFNIVAASESSEAAFTVEIVE